MIASFKPSRLQGAVAAPPSKSMAHRYLMGAAISGQTCALTGIDHSEDILATIRCLQALGAKLTVRGDRVERFEVEITHVDRESRDNRGLMLQVTDPELLELTGGIVQGMSGSPILQNGRIVGAVTHVLVNDPTRGYGIFIENMLEAAE